MTDWTEGDLRCLGVRLVEAELVTVEDKGGILDEVVEEEDEDNEDKDVDNKKVAGGEGEGEGDGEGETE